MKDVVDTQNTATSLKSQNIDGAKIQWGTDTSSKVDKETFHFPEHFDTSNVAVIVNRSIANADAILPVVEVTDREYKINRGDTISGDGQTFNMLAVGGKRSDQNFARVKDANGQDIALVQWGKFVTDTDKDQTFDFPISFTDKCCAVVTNRTEKNAYSNLPLSTSATKDSFTINRPNTIQGAQTFYWVAIGDCGASSASDYFSIPLGNGVVMKGGLATSNTDSAQNFSFHGDDYSHACQTVVTTRINSGSEDILPVTNMAPGSFTIDRSGGILGNEDFYWIAIGK